MWEEEQSMKMRMTLTVSKKREPLWGEWQQQRRAISSHWGLQEAGTCVAEEVLVFGFIGTVRKKVRVLKKVQYWRVAVSSVGQSSPPTVVLNSFILPSSVTCQLSHGKSDMKNHVILAAPPLSPPQCQRDLGVEAAGNDDQHRRQAWRVKTVTKQSIFCKPTQTNTKYNTLTHVFATTCW